MSELANGGTTPPTAAMQLHELEERLADLHEQRRQMLGQTGVHVDAWTVKTWQHDFEVEEASLLAQIAEARARLHG